MMALEEKVNIHRDGNGDSHTNESPRIKPEGHRIYRGKEILQLGLRSIYYFYYYYYSPLRTFRKSLWSFPSIQSDNDAVEYQVPVHVCLSSVLWKRLYLFCRILLKLRKYFEMMDNYCTLVLKCDMQLKLGIEN